MTMARHVSGFLAGIMILCVASTAFGSPRPLRSNEDDTSFLNVFDYGAKGDGQSDDSGAFLKAWEAACNGDKAGQGPTIFVPYGKSFLLRPLQFQGPCKSESIQFQIWGNITAPAKIEEWHNCESGSWILFSEITNLKLTGKGYFDGRGQAWWSKDESQLLPHDDDDDSCDRPKALTFLKIVNLELSGPTHLNSPRAHIRLEDSTSVKLTDLLIQAPEDSPNTDGIAIGASSHIEIRDCTIETGDDCIAIKGGTSNIEVTNVKCGPGHGISVGSLGYEGAHETVEEVYVRNCEFKSSDNGARIKTWEGGSGYVRGILFENIKVSDTKRPIIIDQSYCDDQKSSCKVASSVVTISDVTYRHVRGISKSDLAIDLSCAAGTGCTNIVLDDIDLSSEDGEKSYAECKNVFQASFTSVNPPVSCQNS
ncbi:hypothetical protein BT93_F0735 [Corymbia citriodora subsp. variegata]|nr:hypothetical protein BT93_F0735 [Corymbia citriodora subsp. variegata]